MFCIFSLLNCHREPETYPTGGAITSPYQYDIYMYDIKSASSLLPNIESQGLLVSGDYRKLGYRKSSAVELCRVVPRTWVKIPATAGSSSVCKLLTPIPTWKQKQVFSWGDTLILIQSRIPCWTIADKLTTIYPGNFRLLHRKNKKLIHLPIDTLLFRNSTLWGLSRPVLTNIFHSSDLNHELVALVLAFTQSKYCLATMKTRNEIVAKL